MKYVFMPGCALASYSPLLVKKTFDYLRLCYDHITPIQKCCGKPTKHLGREELFNQRFHEFMKDVSACNADKIITACSGCHNTIRNLSSVDVISLWEVFEEKGLPHDVLNKGKGFPFTVFDSCVTRDNVEIHKSVRKIMERMGYKVIPSEHERENTLCCGLGGMVGLSNPEIAAKTTKKNLDEFKTEHIAVYCATCRQAFCAKGGKAWHLLDLIWGETVNENSLPPTNVLANPVHAWINRYRTKSLIMR